MEYYFSNVGQVAIVDTRIGGFLLFMLCQKRKNYATRFYVIYSHSAEIDGHFGKDRPARYMSNDLFFVGINSTLGLTSKSSN